MRDFVISYDMDRIVRELQRRGIDPWETGMPNCTCCFPHTFELFYVQSLPRLAAWAKYDTLSQLQECFRKVSVERINGAMV
jgi:hypothetical protein